MARDDVGRLLRDQRIYYDLRAPDYLNVTAPPDRVGGGCISTDDTRLAVEDLAPAGDVLELAGGSGGFTRELVPRARTLTVVDGSTRMIDLSRAAVGDPSVEYVCADLFTWRPTRAYDCVFFGYWLSHVPPTHFPQFWELVAECLRPGGRALFVDESDRGTVLETAMSRVGDVPTARRRLRDGREFDIVKVFWEPKALTTALQSLGWSATIHPIAELSYYGAASLMSLP